MSELNEDDELLASLGVKVVRKKFTTRTPRDERIIAGFEDILRFYEAHGRAPQHGEERDIFERLYAVRLDRLREQDDCGSLLSEFDTHGLLDAGDAEVSDHPFVAEHRKLIHKIGVTGGKVETRIANAALDATYLLADVEVVATYKLADINRTKLENLFHRVFASAQLDLTIHDRFGHPVRPKEWFLVPLAVIDEVVSKLRDGSIVEFIYDPKSARLVTVK